MRCALTLSATYYCQIRASTLLYPQSSQDHGNVSSHFSYDLHIASQLRTIASPIITIVSSPLRTAPQLPVPKLQQRTSACQPLMSKSADTLAQDWWHFDALRNAKMISMTKYDGSFAASRWLRILKEELTGQLSPGTWLERADARLEGRATSWAERTPEVVRILAVDNIGAATVEDKNTFIQLLIQEFPDDSYDVITDEKKRLC